MMVLLNARPHASPEGVVDGFILWVYGSQPRGDSSHSEEGGWLR
ncbi:MAG: hypothetical protein ACU85E_05160 [Gammaproteobacteria bacterium]